MLAQALPGLREFRVPFASGVLWLLGGWLAFRDLGVELAPDSELRRAWEALRGLIEPVGAGAILTFAAYLAGVALEPTWRWIWRRTRPVSATGLRVINQVVEAKLDKLPAEEVFVFAWIASSRGRETLERMALEDAAISRTFDDRLDESAEARPEEALLRAVVDQGDDALTKVRRALKRELVPDVVEELDMVARRLLGDERDIFQDYDRARAESEFRLAILLPLLVTIVAALESEIGASVIILACAAIAVVLVLQASRQRAEGGDHVAGALRFGAVQAPVLQPLEPGRYTLAKLSSGALEVETVGTRQRERWMGSTPEQRAQRMLRPERFVDLVDASVESGTDLSLKGMVVAFRTIGAMISPRWLYRPPPDAIAPEEQRRVFHAVTSDDHDASLWLADRARSQGHDKYARSRYTWLAGRGVSAAHARLSAMHLQDGDLRAAEEASRRALFSARSPAERELAELGLRAADARRASSS